LHTLDPENAVIHSLKPSVNLYIKYQKIVLFTYSHVRTSYSTAFNEILGKTRQTSPSAWLIKYYALKAWGVDV
jgi:hypothetical protein